MIPCRCLAFVGLALSTLACVMPPAVSELTDVTPVGTPSFEPPASLFPTDALVPVPLHAGYGIEGHWFQLYFTDPTAPESRQTTGGIDERLVQAIDSARLSVHLAMYNLTLNDVRAALVRAHRRGLDVRLVAETDNIDGDDFQRLIGAGIPVLGDRRESTMHDKFMIIDASEVWTGSMNFTVSGAYSDNNTVIRVRSPELARIYDAEFAQMFDKDQFGDHGASAPPAPALNIDGTTVQVYFAPDNRPEADLVDLLSSANHSINFLAYSFTSNPLGAAVRDAYRLGIEVRGVMDADQAAFNIGTELADFRKAGLDVRLDGNPGLMHEKILIVDEEIVVVGSYNFSRSANESNDENLLVIHNSAIAREFAREFERVYAAASN